MDEYEQLAREAEARSEWEKLDGVNGNYLITSKGVIMCNDDNIQFILDTIRLLPQLVRELQEAKAQERKRIAEYLDNEEEAISKSLQDYQHPLNLLDDEQIAKEQGKMEILNELAQWLRREE